MIQGIQLDLATNKLADHLHARAAYHASRRDHYLAEFKRRTNAVIEGEEELDADEGFSNSAMVGYRNDSAIEQAKRHRAKAAYFRFIGENLIPNETYRLSESDLSKLELAA